MPASITLSALAWFTPDGSSVLSDLTFGFGRERAGLIGRNGAGKSTLVKLIAGGLEPRSGSVTVSGRLGILPQTVDVGPDETVADLFGATKMLALLRRAEKGEAGADDLANADWTLEGRIRSALGRVGLEADPGTRLAALSGGERTRAGLAAAIVDEPDFLILDEPTNNLDREGRQAVIALLAGWAAGAIVVSHDRELLETMDSIVELTSLGIARYGGSWTHYRERKALELAAAHHDLATAQARSAELARQDQVAAERKSRKDAAGKRNAAKGGHPRILLGGMKDRSEDSGGAIGRVAERRNAEARQAVAAARDRIEVLQPLSVAIPSTGLPANRTLVSLDKVTAGYEPGQPVVQDLCLTIVGPERVAVTGPNGSGKTTVLALVSGTLRPWSGTVRIAADFAVLDQRAGLLDPAATVRDNFRRLNPKADENACRSALARFMFRAGAALRTVSTLSGGQILRAGLACVLGGPTPPSLLVLDEPTNHLDLESIEAVEAGLRAYDGALLVVSHDEAFLESIAISRRLDLQGARRGVGMR